MISIIEWRRRSKVLAVTLVCLALASLAPAAWGDSSYLPNDKIMIDVVDVPLGTVIGMLAKQTTLNLVMATTPEEAQKKVSAHVDGQPIEKVLNNILTAAGVKYRKTDDGTYLIGVAEEPKPYQEPVMVAQIPVPTNFEQAPIRKTRTVVIKLKHSSARDIEYILKNMPAMDEEFSLVEPQGLPSQRPVENFDRSIYAPVGANTPSYPPGAPSPAYTAPPVDDARSNKTDEAGRTPDAFSTAGQYTPGRQTGTTRPGSTTGRPGAAPATTSTTNQSGGLRPEGVDFIMAFDVDNSIIVRGDDDGIAELKELIRMLDVPPRQVQIKAEFIEVSTNMLSSLGIGWSLDRLNTTFSTFQPSGNVVLGVVTGNVTAQLRAELTSGKGKIVNSPIISTINNMPAEISIGQEIPLFLSNVVATGNGSFATTTTVASRPIRTGLTVLPRINGDDSVTMNIHPTVEDTGRIYKGPDGTEVPETRFQQLQTNRRVMNGETIVVGGFIRRSDSQSMNKVPLLGDLPIIGGLFRNKSNEAEDRELLIFLTPTIIHDTGGSATGVRPQLGE